MKPVKKEEILSKLKKYGSVREYDPLRHYEPTAKGFKAYEITVGLPKTMNPLKIRLYNENDIWIIIATRHNTYFTLRTRETKTTFDHLDDILSHFIQLFYKR